MTTRRILGLALVVASLLAAAVDFAPPRSAGTVSQGGVVKVFYTTPQIAPSWWVIVLSPLVAVVGLVLLILPARPRQRNADTLSALTRPSSRLRLWFGFLAGLLYLALVAGIFCLITGSPFPLVFAAVVAGSLFCGGLGLAWITLWAVRKDARLGQFTVGSLLFLMVFVAIFFGMVRWLATRIAEQDGAPDDLFMFAWFTVMCLVLTGVAIPLVLRMTEAVLWAAVWLVRRPAVRHWLAARRKARPGS
jgi:hypothetical protein